MNRGRSGGGRTRPSAGQQPLDSPRTRSMYQCFPTRVGRLVPVR